MTASTSLHPRIESGNVAGQFIGAALCLLLSLSAFAESVSYRLELPSVGVNAQQQPQSDTPLPIGKLRLNYRAENGEVHILDIDDPGFVRLESLNSAGDLVHHGERYQAFSLNLSTADLGITRLDSLSVYRATKSHGLQQLLSSNARELSLQTRPSARPESYVVTVSDYINNGNGDLEVDIVVLGDGYTEAQAADFQEDATASV